MLFPNITANVTHEWKGEVNRICPITINRICPIKASKIYCPGKFDM